MDETTMAFCGLVCWECPAHQATRTDDRELLERTARTWSEHMGEEIAPDSIVCDGCKTGEGRMAFFCAACKVRACAAGRGLDSCAPCPDYACDKLEELFGMIPDARAKLEQMRQG
jgi:hypothetical protein